MPLTLGNCLKESHFLFNLRLSKASWLILLFFLLLFEEKNLILAKMGIQELESFIRRNSTGIDKEINIFNEIEIWKRNHHYEKSPTIIVDLKNFEKYLKIIDEGRLIMGGRYGIYNKKINDFFEALTSPPCSAKLVFFCRPYVQDIDQDLIQKKHDALEGKRLKSCLDEIKKDSHFSWYHDTRFLYNMTQICQAYGTMCTRIKGNSVKIIEYAHTNAQDILAIITCDTDFMFIKAKYQYWSLMHLDLLKFKTKSYCRETLLEHMGLTKPESHKLLGISKLEKVIVKFDEIKNRWAGYVKKFDPSRPWEYEKILHEISNHFNHEKFDVHDFTRNLSFYSFGADVDFRSMDENCKDLAKKLNEKQLYFVYRLLVEKLSTNKSLAYIDLQKKDAGKFVALAIKILFRQCGVILKDHVNPPKERQTKLGKRSNLETIHYPPMQLPSLEDLIVNENDARFNDQRWTLLQWLLDLEEETILQIRDELPVKCSKLIRVVLLTLKFLQMNEIITTREANIILTTELDVQAKREFYIKMIGIETSESDLDKVIYEANMEMSWIQLAHKYTISFEIVCHCLELCGFRKQTDLIQFDSFLFFSMMSYAKDNPKVLEMIDGFIGNLPLW
ncbi:uncharacterized protein LOC116344351 [Contarinia nasturtii]|uniref:uncharacterized protein LOC116344351 n=1 Tax=Contarinia nasturtii TaxID=265458 RepID=UPI0012D378D5|nr:uncharacterized protein LOC116344351 [Contarinia nasturtii]